MPGVWSPGHEAPLGSVVSLADPPLVSPLVVCPLESAQSLLFCNNRDIGIHQVWQESHNNHILHAYPDNKRDLSDSTAVDGAHVAPSVNVVNCNRGVKRAIDVIVNPFDDNFSTPQVNDYTCRSFDCPDRHVDSMSHADITLSQAGIVVPVSNYVMCGERVSSSDRTDHESSYYFW